MGKLFILLLTLVFAQSFAVNRLATSGDVAGFSAMYPVEYAMYLRNPSVHPLMTLNDIIMDTRTSVPNNSLGYSDLSVSFPGARFGYTVWISSTITGTPLKGWGFGNSDTGSGDATHPNRFRSLGGQLRVRHTSTNPNNSTVTFGDFRYLDLNFTRDDFPGHDNRGVFLEGTFGLLIDAEGDWVTGSQMLTIDGDVKRLRIEGIELAGGFAGLRMFPTGVSPSFHVESFTMINFFIREGLDGEGIYTSKSVDVGPYVIFDNVYIANGVIAGRPLENFQLQHFPGNGGSFLMENTISYNSAQDWRGEVNTVGQSQNYQIIFEEGNVVFRNNIICGTSANFVYSDNGDQGSPDRSNRVVYDNMLMYGTKNRGAYISADDAVTPIEFNNIDIGGYSEEWWQEGWTAAGAPTYWLHIQNPIEFIGRNMNYDNGLGYLIGNNLTRVNSTNNNAATVSAPQFKNPGIAYDCEQWNVQYGALLPTAGTPITYKVNKEVWYRTNGLYYKCILQHDSDDANPTNATYWLPLTWDEEGDRNDSGNWDSGDTQSVNPPWDFRLVANSEDNLKGRGLWTNEDNTSQTYFKWETATDNTGTNLRRLWRFKDKNASKTELLEEIESGDYVRRTIYSPGVSPKVESWVQIN